MTMTYTCKFCNGRGKQNSGLSCISCRGHGFFDITDNIEDCSACKGIGRAAIRALPCISCGGKGFLIKATGLKSEEKKTEHEKTAVSVPTLASASTSIVKSKMLQIEMKKAVTREEFSEEHLDSLQEKLTEILESP